MGGYDPSAFYVIGDTVLANNWKKNQNKQPMWQQSRDFLLPK